MVVIRPEPGNAETVAAARAMGLEAVAMPLQAVEPVAWDVPAGDFDGLLIGSANAFRHGGAGLRELLSLPVYAVGKRTAEEAETKGFSIARVGEGGLQSLMASMGKDRQLRFLRLAGEEHLPLDIPPHISVETRIVYRVSNLSIEDADALSRPCCILVHSASAARNLISQCDTLDIDRSQISIAALGPRIAAACGPGWSELRSAEKPREDALLALAQDMCH